MQLWDIKMHRHMHASSSGPRERMLNGCDTFSFRVSFGDSILCCIG